LRIMATLDDEDYILSLLQMPDKVEVKEWLAHGGKSHYIGEMSHEESVELVKELYQLGALRVDAVEIATNAGLASTDHLIVTLPQQKDQRQEIFNWNNNRVHFMGVDPDIDLGQNYLLVYFD
jgi:hypothetical protein